MQRALETFVRFYFTGLLQFFIAECVFLMGKLIARLYYAKLISDLTLWLVISASSMTH